MKTVTIEGKEYEVPDWVNWVAMDAVGVWYGYDQKPDLSMQSGKWLGTSEKMFYIVNPNRNWMETLQEV